MQNFTFYFKFGWQHILSWFAVDHLLFVLALCAIYLIENWKQVLVLVTAFTIGHSITLALSVYNVIKISDNIVELLIPITILATAIFNFFQKEFTVKSLRLNYFLALFFGLIHGLGFANTIRFIMTDDESIGFNLFSFNVGVEAGQIVVVLFILLLSYLIVNTLKLQRRWWVWILSSITIVVALKMINERWIS